MYSNRAKNDVQCTFLVLPVRAMPTQEKKNVVSNSTTLMCTAEESAQKKCENQSRNFERFVFQRHFNVVAIFFFVSATQRQMRK